MPPRTTLQPTVREIAGGVISPPPPPSGTEGCASSPGGDGLTAFFNAHSHGIPEDSRDSRRLVTFPTRDDREFCSETGIPKLVPIRFWFRCFDFYKCAAESEEPSERNSWWYPGSPGILGIPWRWWRSTGWKEICLVTIMPRSLRLFPRGGGRVRRFRGANKHCQFPSTRRFGESSWDSASLRYYFPHRKRKGILRGIWNWKMSVRSRQQSQHVSHIYAYATGRISR